MGPPDGLRMTVCLTLDVEPDYARTRTFGILDQTTPFFDWYVSAGVPITAFVTGQLLEQGHALVDRLLTAGLSIGLHGFSHAPQAFGTMHDAHADELQRGIAAYERRLGRRPIGYRAPAGIISRADLLFLDQAGFRYDASVFPLKRPRRYDFSRLPCVPFKWAGTKLVEMPFGRMMRGVPAGMTFINLLGARLSVLLIRQQCAALAGLGFGQGQSPYVVDAHFHNLFTDRDALRSLPPFLKLVYRAGSMGSGLTRLADVVTRLRDGGAVFADLDAEAQRMAATDLPTVGFDCFAREL